MIDSVGLIDMTQKQLSPSPEAWKNVCRWTGAPGVPNTVALNWVSRPFKLLSMGIISNGVIVINMLKILLSILDGWPLFCIDRVNNTNQLWTIWVLFPRKNQPQVQPISSWISYIQELPLVNFNHNTKVTIIYIVYICRNKVLPTAIYVCISKFIYIYSVWVCQSFYIIA